MQQKLKLPPCGAFCKICKDFKKGKCKGCLETEGKPWFLKFTKFKVCPIFECVKNQKIISCMDCKKFPCRKFLNWYNPKIGFFKSSIARIGSLFLRKKLGDRKWKSLLKKY